MSSGSSDIVVRRSSWTRWKIVTAIVTAGVIVPVVAFVIWFNGDSDLRAIERLAKQQGAALTWQELNVAASPAGTLALIGRLRQCEPLTRQYWDKQPVILGTPVSPDYIAHYVNDSDAIVELIALADALGSDVIQDDANPFRSGMQPGMWPVKRTIDFLCDRLRAVEPSELPVEVHRICRLIKTIPPNSTLCFVIKWGSLKRLLASLTYRLADIGATVPDTIDPALALVEDLPSFYRECAKGQLVYQWVFLQDASRRVRDQGMNLPKILDTRAGLEFWCRAGRSGVLQKQLEWLRFLSTGPDLVSMWQESKGYRIARGWTIMLRPADLLTIALMPDYKDLNPWTSEREITVRMTLELSLLARVLHAETHGSDWPSDVFDPNGNPLRRIERGGKLIGAYSVGEDGIDDHGSRSSDKCWPLYEELGRPKAKDPVPAP